MNYGELSELTDDDKNDLMQLYQLVWNGELTHINGTPIRLVEPFNTLASPASGVFAVAPVQKSSQQQSSLAYLDVK